MTDLSQRILEIKRNYQRMNISLNKTKPTGDFILMTDNKKVLAAYAKLSNANSKGTFII